MALALTARWRDWVSFALGLWLAVSPWALGYAPGEAATANAAFAGLLIALGSHFDASFDGSAAEWVNLGAGLWLVVAPFLLGFWMQAIVAANSIAVGTTVAALASSALATEKGLERWWQRREASH